jgi:galactokinase
MNIEKLKTQKEQVGYLKKALMESCQVDTALPFFLVTVPLRLAPLGAHSDHQGGTVTGFAINRSIQLLGQPTRSRNLSVAGLNFGEFAEVDFDKIPYSVAGDWRNYARGSVQALQNLTGDLTRGFNGVVHGAMPIGGLSSSAAVTLAYLTALQHVNSVALSPLQLIMLVRAVENGYLGLHNGILDQSVIVSSKRDALTVIDCASHSVRDAIRGASNTPWEIMVVFSGLSRQLTATPFNQRVAECHAAARELMLILGKDPTEKPLLGDISREEYLNNESKLSDLSRKRARHFFTEADRVREGVEAWERGDIKRFGELVTESGNSSIINFESGSPALISLYEILAKIPGVYGTRFCGGGFQGCVLALIDPRMRDSVSQSLHEHYTNRHPELADLYSLHFCETSNGISVEEIQC